MSSINLKTPSRISTPVKTFKRKVLTSSQTKKEYCIICGGKTTPTQRLILFKYGRKTDFAKELELQLDIDVCYDTFPHVICTNCKDKFLTLKRKSQGLKSAYQSSCHSWYLKYGKAEIQKRMLNSSPLESLTFQGDVELGVAPLEKTPSKPKCPSKIPVASSRSLLRPLKVGQVSLLSMPARPATVIVFHTTTPKKDAPLQNKSTQTEVLNPALQFDTTDEEACVSFTEFLKSNKFLINL